MGKVGKIGKVDKTDKIGKIGKVGKIGKSGKIHSTNQIDYTPPIKVYQAIRRIVPIVTVATMRGV